MELTKLGNLLNHFVSGTLKVYSSKTWHLIPSKQSTKLNTKVMKKKYKNSLGTFDNDNNNNYNNNIFFSS